MRACCLSCTPAPRHVLAPVAAAPADARGRRVLALLAEDDATISFQGMRRRLGMHPQALTRTLDRLVEAGAVDRLAGGYKILDPGRRAVAHEAAPQPRATELVRLALGPDSRPDQAAASLAGTWFDGLRWYGCFDGPGETCLMWLAAPSDGVLRLRLLPGVAVVDALAGPEQAATMVRVAHTLAAALAQRLDGM